MDPRIQALQDRKTAILTEAKSLEDKMKSGALTAEEGTQFDALMAEHDGIQPKIDAIIADNRANDDRSRRLAVANSSRLTLPTRSQQTPGSNVIVKPDGFMEDPKKGFKSPLDFLENVRTAGVDMHYGRSVQDKRLLHLSADRFPQGEMAVGSDEARGNSAPSGGFLIPEAFSPNLLQINPEDDQIGGRTTKVPMALPSVKMPIRVDKDHSTSVSGGLTVTRKPETVAGSSSQVTFGQADLVAHTLFGISYATEEMLTDSPITFSALIAAGFSQQFIAHLIRERLRGLGVGEFTGVLKSGCLVSITKETNQLAATIVKENIDKARARCWGYDKAIWLANYDTLPMLLSLVQVVGVGGVPVPYLQTNADGSFTLCGRPIFFTEYASTLGTTGDLILGNWSEYLEGIYQPMQSAESIHVRFTQHERTFKFWLRNAGMPWWSSALTPQNGANTLSPFVVIETR